MTDNERDNARRRSAWEILGALERHPKITDWRREARRGRRRWFGPFWLRASVVAMVCLLAVIAGRDRLLHDRSQVFSAETAIGAMRVLKLPDRSQVTLNSNTKLTVRYSSDHREVHIFRGEAMFSVIHDESRPFEVNANGVTTRSIGTEFDVRVEPDSVVVAVVQGAVRVTADANAVRVDLRHAVRTLTASHQIIDEPVDVYRLSAWTKGLIEFSATPLREAVAEINRYSARHVTIGSQSLENVMVGGVFRTGDVDAFLFAMREGLHVDVVSSSAEFVLVEAPSGERKAL